MKFQNIFAIRGRGTDMPKAAATPAADGFIAKKDLLAEVFGKTSR